MGMDSYRNGILARLSPEITGRLQLQKLEMENRHSIGAAGEEIQSLLFLETGMASMVNCFHDGSGVEVGVFGFESVIGVAALMGARRNLHDIFMQLSGWGYAVPLELAEAEFRRGEQFHDLILRYSQAHLVQVLQTAGCNLRHRLEERLARWLLLCHDRTGGSVMHLTQDFLSQMLGVERPAVSVIASRLQEQGLIEYSRGRLRVLNRPGLEQVACECYAVVKKYLHSCLFLDEVTG
jgi:CRP-like cAMP-binding protein